MLVCSAQRCATHPKGSGRARSEVGSRSKWWIDGAPTVNWLAARIAAIGQNTIHREPTGSNRSSDRMHRHANRIERSRIKTPRIVLITVRRCRGGEFAREFIGHNPSHTNSIIEPPIEPIKQMVCYRRIEDTK